MTTTLLKRRKNIHDRHLSLEVKHAFSKEVKELSLKTSIAYLPVKKTQYTSVPSKISISSSYDNYADSKLKVQGALFFEDIQLTKHLNLKEVHLPLPSTTRNNENRNGHIRYHNDFKKRYPHIRLSYKDFQGSFLLLRNLPLYQFALSYSLYGIHLKKTKKKYSFLPDELVIAESVVKSDTPLLFLYLKKDFFYKNYPPIEGHIAFIKNHPSLFKSIERALIIYTPFFFIVIKIKNINFAQK